MNKTITTCIIGGGHIGTALACYIKKINSDITVNILTNRPDSFSNPIKCNDIENDVSFYSKIDIISDNANKCVSDADIIYIALPHFLIEDTFNKICKYVKKDAAIGILPGGGGCELYFYKYFTSSATLFGFQRAPFTAKLVEYGKEVNLKSWKPFSVLASIPIKHINRVESLINKCGLKTHRANNYLEVALTPTNPVLHTVRTYELFRQYESNHEFNEKFKFYVGWTDEASKNLLAVDSELHLLLDKIASLNTDAIRPLTEHYESYSIKEMTAKINNISTFQSVYAPLKINNNGKYIADLDSRMFTEDFPWGLVIIKSYCDLYNVQTPTIDTILKWYSNYMRYEWFIDDKFEGKDLDNTGHIKRYGIVSKEQLERIYQ